MRSNLGTNAIANELARSNMVNGQVITVGITDRRLISALSAVPRELFVPQSTSSLAYRDTAVLLKAGTQTSPPRYLIAAGDLARLVQESLVTSQDAVLDVGSTTGYSSAILGQLAESVTALESDEDLVSQATVALRNLAGNNVRVVSGQLEAGWPDAGPYDVILLGGSIEFVPAELFAQLAIGGRLVAVIGSGNAASGTVFVKGGAAIGSRRTFNAALPPLPGFAKPRTFVF